METNVITSAVIEVKQVLYTGKVHIAGGRDGSAKSTDGRLDIALSSPGSKGAGTNPEQLFAAGWSACFIGAMRHNASAKKVALPENTTVDAEVDLGTNENGFLLQARLHVNLPGLSADEAKAIVEAAHNTCPYSKATRGNINITISVAV
ncbi:Ohr subfamily peroxiredoxin [Mucilaginibacter yixingensis]|uniref:Ohr subfamily peroxiredoxin n=1 Tax=Mucilaginibacter yixingensis TaxID=1295612 RepID=A0A2T5JG61_9SPHI|nr:organic hydroperoxide resistance protein [Mucilaginibacter yixingensis]PTR01395.1 Ohr subfamily peroxiredoxin [Mucilaginibacter yixingensis]